MASRPRDNPGYVDSQLLEAITKKTGSIKQRSYELMRPQPGQRLLDVGCGPGIDVAALARIVGGDGSVVGIDYDPAMVEAARARARDEGMQDRVELEQAEATQLPFPDAAFDGSRCERVFQHVPGPVRILEEMARVTKPAGWLVVADTDWYSLSINTSETDVERKLGRRWVERFESSTAARRLYGMLQARGCAEVSVEAYPVILDNYPAARYFGLMDRVEAEALSEGSVREAQLERWRADLEAIDRQNAFFASVNVVVAAGRNSSTE